VTRSISPGMAPVLEQLELNRADVVTTANLGRLLADAGVATPARVVAARLRATGWLLPTGQRGAWEFAPADRAGPYSAHDPVTPLKAFLAAHPSSQAGLTFQAAAWAHGLADRAPARPEVAVPDGRTAGRLPAALAGHVFSPVRPPHELRGVPVLTAASVLAHMAAAPRAVRSWAAARAWLGPLATEVTANELLAELDARPQSVRTRCGYLVQGLRPDLADAIRARYPASARTWFGPRGPGPRHDPAWRIADTLLPFDPRTLEAVR